MSGEPNRSIAEQIFDISCGLGARLLELPYDETVRHVYNPVQYAAETHMQYLQVFCAAVPKPVMLLGMNPGPWGMAQTGVPFGEVGSVRDWLGISGEVGRPEVEHPKRPVVGFHCKRSEVSGQRLWSLLRRLCGDDPAALAAQLLLHNYCPLLFLKQSGANVTPSELKVQHRRALEELCDEALRQAVAVVDTRVVVAVGGYTHDRAVRALQGCSVRVCKLLHPSPRNPLANVRWQDTAIRQLRQADILQYFPTYTDDDCHASASPAASP